VNFYEYGVSKPRKTKQIITRVYVRSAEKEEAAAKAF